MKKLMNKPDQFVTEMLEGILAAHPDELQSVGNDLHCLVAVGMDAARRKVAIVTGGGSGHLPLFLGFVGPGLLDGVAVGNVFASPSARQIAQVTSAVDRGHGVLFLYGNYSGDVINFGMASEMADVSGIRTVHVTGNDDAASSVKGEEDKRRGVAGIYFAYKAAGAAADEGLDLEGVARVTRKAVDRTRTVGVALSPCIIPEVGRPGFTIGDNEMELGMGIHGEKGISRTALKTADETVDAMLDIILTDMPIPGGSTVSVLVNGLGATPREELYILYRRVHKILVGKGITLRRVRIGEFATSMEMSGASVSVILLDEELSHYLDCAASSPLFPCP
ncbi:MAG: dihydroxyacetone kinase [Spirochaetes bacterium RIFOXYC1_FULL_54_7]|nr:MAG: dihydroxyacetone kinase [Spirochaetes bacterium RIFOXYC1_FULL_54_7]